MIDRYPGVVDSRMHHAERVALRRPPVVVDGTRMSGDTVVGGLRIDLVDGDDFTRLGLRQQLAVMKAPPCSRVAAERAAVEFRVGARARMDIDNAHFQDIAWLGIANGDRARADMH